MKMGSALYDVSQNIGLPVRTLVPVKEKIHSMIIAIIVTEVSVCI